MDVAWWLVLAVATGWQLRQGLHRFRTASRRIDSDIATLHRDHPRPVSLMVR
jgi:hypothetical protein